MISAIALICRLRLRFQTDYLFTPELILVTAHLGVAMFPVVRAFVRDSKAI